MNRRTSFRTSAMAWLSALMIAVGPGLAQQPASPSAAPSAAAAPAAAPMKQEELDQLLAPIALYPDSLLSQMFMASTYPLEIVEADRWAKANKDLKDDALTAELEKKTWDASVKSLVNFPDILSMMSEKLEMTTKLGDAFIADQKRMMDTVQKLRAKAKDAGNLKSTEQMVVKTEPPAAGSTTEVIVIESPSPQVVYVPSYNPTVVYGSWPYPSYPPYPYYPPQPHPWAAGAIGFGVGLACGAAWGYAWGGCDWHGGDVDVDIDRNTNINNNIDRSKAKAEFNNRTGGAGANGRGSFQHDPSHRQGVAYRDKGSQQKYGGQRANQTAQARNEYRGKAEAGRQDIARGGASDFQGRGAGTGAGQSRSGAGVQDRSAGGAQNRSGAGGASPQNRPAGAGAGAQNRPANTVGTRSSAYDGVNRSSSQVQAASNRGASSRNTSGISGAQRPSGGVSRSPSGGGYSRPSGGGGRGGGGGGRR